MAKHYFHTPTYTKNGTVSALSGTPTITCVSVNRATGATASVALGTTIPVLGNATFAAAVTDPDLTTYDYRFRATTTESVDTGCLVFDGLWTQYGAQADVHQLNGAKTDGTPATADRPELYLKHLRIINPSDDGVYIQGGDEYNGLYVYSEAGEAVRIHTNGAGQNPFVVATADGTWPVPTADQITAALTGSTWAGNVTSGIGALQATANATSGTLSQVQATVNALSGTVALRGSGADSVTLTITDGASPIADADVWVASDSAGTNVVAGTLQTDSDGQVTFLLDAGSTYYLFMQKNGVNPIHGRSFVAVAD